MLRYKHMVLILVTCAVFIPCEFLQVFTLNTVHSGGTSLVSTNHRCPTTSQCVVPIPAVDEDSKRAPMPEKRSTKPHSFVLNVEALVAHALQMRLDQGGAVLLAILDNAE